MLSQQAYPDYVLIWLLICRKIYLVNTELQVQSELTLKPNCGRVSQLSWLTNSTLLATSHEGIQTWQCDGDSSKPCLLLGMSIGLVTAEPCPDQSTLAAGSRDGVVSPNSLSATFAKLQFSSAYDIKSTQ